MKEPERPPEAWHGPHDAPAPLGPSFGPGPGVTALEAAQATGMLTLDRAASILAMHRFEYDEMIAYLHETKGNQFVFEVQQLVGEPHRGTGVPEDKLLQWEPVGERGPEGQAAWIVEAVRQKFATAFGETFDQLKAIAKGKKKIESTEVIPAEGKDNDIEPKRKAGKDSHGRQQGVYDVAVDDAPILSVIVSLLRGHIREFHYSGKIEPEPMFELGTFLRRDPGFNGGAGSDHTQAGAFDLGGMKFSTADDVIDVLQALPPKALAAVFPDNSSHLHLAVRDGAYRIGLGFEGEFFPTKLEQAEAKKNAVKGKRHTDHPRAVWLEKWSSKVFTSKATWDDAAQKWTWSPKRETGDDARDKLKSEPLKDALKALQPAPMNEATEAEIESDGG